MPHIRTTEPYLSVSNTKIASFLYMAKGMHINTRRRIKLVCDIVNQHYEPGNQSKCYKAVYRRYVNPVYPMCYHTFLKYINTPVMDSEADKQLKLF